MSRHITPEQVETYRRQGFLLVENFFDADELARWRRATDDAVERRLAQLERGRGANGSSGKSLRSRLKDKIGKDNSDRLRGALRSVLGKRLVPIGFNGALDTNQGDLDSYYAKVYIQCIHLAAESEMLRELIVDPELGEAAAVLMGADGVRLYHDQAIYKPALGNPTAWHLDRPYWSFSSPMAMTMWVALEDATLSNGCMHYIPGSHLTATDKNLSIDDDFSGLFKLYPEWKKVNPVPCPAPAGSVVFHNGGTAHGAGVNMTNKPRKAFAVAFMPEGATFNGNKDVLPTEYFRRLRVGDLLNDERHHPLIWSKPKVARPGLLDTSEANDADAHLPIAAAM
ncbi:MAG: phytanoyl-CoA dioxygenase family protein [Tepidisphaeraceae bacterium]